MITREQFEAHVRAEAEVKYQQPGIEYEDEHWYDLVSEHKLIQRNSYIAARMEHEWPLVEAAQAVVDRWDSPLWKDVARTGEFIGRLREALSPYTTNPIEP